MDFFFFIAKIRLVLVRRDFYASCDTERLLVICTVLCVFKSILDKLLKCVYTCVCVCVCVDDGYSSRPGVWKSRGC